MSLPVCARYLSKTEYAVRGLVRRHQIPFYKTHGRLLFDAGEIDAWVRQQDWLPLTTNDEQEGHDEGKKAAPDQARELVLRHRAYLRSAAEFHDGRPRRRNA
jgi:hypothetical protein